MILVQHLPFFLACVFGNIEIVKLLLTVGNIDTNKTNNYGRTPFCAACWKGRIEIVKLLLNDERIDVNEANVGI